MRRLSFWAAACSLVLFACEWREDRGLIVANLPVPTMQSLDIFQWQPQAVLAQGTLFEGLFGFDSLLQVVPKACASWEVKDGSKTWVLHLRPDLKWSNGDPLRAQDFMFSWMRQLEPGRPAEIWASFLDDVQGAADFKSRAVTQEQLGLKVIDSLTLEIRLKWAMDLRPKLVLATAMPLHRASYEAALKAGEPWWEPKNLVVNGPYKPVSFRKDQELVLEPNPNYQGTRGNLQRIRLKMGGQAVQVQGYEALDLDVAHVMTMGDYKYVQESPHLRGQVFAQDKYGFHGFQMARTINPLLEKKELRLALAFSADRAGIARGVLGGRVVPTEVYGPASDTMLQGLTTLSFNLDSARYYLRRSGYPLDLPLQSRPVLHFFAPPSNDLNWAGVVEALQAGWRELGINVQIENMEQILLERYTWGGGYFDEPAFERPGVTMYTGEVLWPNSTMALRLADHVWYYQNFPFALKKEIKSRYVEADQFSLSQRGSKAEDWKLLDPMAEELAELQASILRSEPDSNYREELAQPDFASSYARIRKAWSPSLKVEEQEELWLRARQFINEGNVAMSKWTENSVNRASWRDMAHLKRMYLDTAGPMVRKLQQEALRQAWIIPLYTEKLVYLQRPWLKGAVVNRFGKHVMLFNLQYLRVDTNLRAKEL